MANLELKLEQSIAQYNENVRELENLKASLLVQQGAIQALQNLINEEKESEPAEPEPKPSKKEKAIQDIQNMIQEP